MKAILSLVCAMLALTACLARTAPPDDFIQLARNSEFDGAKLRFFTTMDDGTAVSVNAADDVIESMPGATPMPGQQAQALTFLQETEEGTSVAHALLSWDPDNPADYLMFGWWTQFPDQHPPGLSFEGSVRYAVIDGPEIDHGIVPQLPVAGTATYAGQPGGLCSYVFGSDWGENEGDFVIDEYRGVRTMTGRFRGRHHQGLYRLLWRSHHAACAFRLLGEDPRDTQGLAKDYELHLAIAIFGEDGQFERDRVALRHPERTITLSEEGWGGALSRRQDTDGTPWLVAGFNSLYFEEGDGSKGEFVGSFLGLSDTFRQNGTSPPPGNGG